MRGLLDQDMDKVTKGAIFTIRDGEDIWEIRVRYPLGFTVEQKRALDEETKKDIEKIALESGYASLDWERDDIL